MRHDAALVSCQGKYSPALEGSWLGPPVHSHCRGHGNKLHFELANTVLLFCLRGREERNLPGALLCSTAGFVVPDLIKGCVGGSTEGKEKGEKQVGGAGNCTAESVGLQQVLPGMSSGKQKDSQAPGLLCSVLSWEQDAELAPRSPAWGQPGGAEAKPGHPSLNVWPPAPAVLGASMLCLQHAPQVLPASP